MPHTNKVEENLLEEFHIFSVNMAHRCETGYLEYKDVERTIASWWIEKLTQTRQETIEECIAVVPNKIEYSEPSIGGDLQSIKYKNHKELGYNQARTDFIKALGQLKQNK